MNEKVQINLESTKNELLNDAERLMTAISKLAEGIGCLDFSGDPADLEADAREYADSIETLSEIAQMYIFHAKGEL